MSRAFVKEDDDQWLHDISPTLNALIHYLTKENNGVRVYEKRSYVNAQGKQVHEMSNGLTYAVNEERQWYILE